MSVAEWKKDGTVAVITMTNGENRINPTYTSTMIALFDDILNDSEVSSVVIISSDPKNWSQGIDLDWMMGRMAENDTEAIKGLLYGFNDLFKKALLFPMPVIAAMNGHAAAGGAIFACACDFRFMRSDRGFFFFPEIDIGIPFLPGMLAFSKKAMPYPLFNDMMLTGRRLTAPELKQHNVIVKACPSAEETISEAIAYAKTLNKKRGIFGITKLRMHGHMVEVLEKEDPEIIESMNLIVTD
jgi:enoyl-CoA hydratase/carnithine racemase